MHQQAVYRFVVMVNRYPLTYLISLPNLMYLRKIIKVASLCTS
jgi:hypothetical protein